LLSRAWRRVGSHTFADISDERAASIFRVEAKVSMLLRKVRILFPCSMTPLAEWLHHPATSNLTIMNFFVDLKTQFWGVSSPL
jgi:hypothetical protein